MLFCSSLTHSRVFTAFYYMYHIPPHYQLDILSICIFERISSTSMGGVLLFAASGVFYHAIDIRMKCILLGYHIVALDFKCSSY